MGGAPVGERFKHLDISMEDFEKWLTQLPKDSTFHLGGSGLCPTAKYLNARQWRGFNDWAVKSEMGLVYGERNTVYQLPDWAFRLENVLRDYGRATGRDLSDRQKVLDVLRSLKEGGLYSSWPDRPLDV